MAAKQTQSSTRVRVRKPVAQKPAPPKKKPAPAPIPSPMPKGNPRGGPKPFPGSWKQPYLAAFMATGRKLESAIAAGVNYSTVWNEKKKNPEFAEQEQCAQAVAVARLEDEAVRRAVEGCRKEYYDKHGNLTRVETEYSDTLLLRLLETHDPRYRSKSSVDVTGGPKVYLNKEERDRDVELFNQVQAEIAEARRISMDEG